MTPLALIGMALLFASFAPGCGRQNRDVPVTITGHTMGTTYSVKIARLPDKYSKEQIQKEIEQRLETVNRQMSTWRKDSEISRFNTSAETGWFAVSKDTVTVVREAQRISQLSGGAFDVTVGPLVNLWSFGPEHRPRKIPTDAEIAARRESVGFAKLTVRDQPPGLKKSVAGLRIDLSAIAKGFAVDRVAKYLDSLNVTGYLVEIGGEVRCSGTRSDGTAWKIGIQSPDTSKKVPHRIVLLKDRAMATSGDYRNYFESAGKRYSHTIDPRTGRPVKHGLASVSVVADSCMTADALATTIMVLGPDAGYNFAQRHNLAVLLLVPAENGFSERATSQFKELFARTENAP